MKFFSIGSNDLIQYTLAADRTNEKVSHLYEPTHPAIMRLIKMTVDAAHQHGIWAGVCGEIAGDPVLAPLLIGLGVDELSAAPPVVPQVKYIIRQAQADRGAGTRRVRAAMRIAVGNLRALPEARARHRAQPV